MTNKYDELLIEGLSKLKELEFSHIPEADKINYTFSEEYVKSKEKLLNKLGTSYWKYINTAVKKVAVIIVALIISFSSLMTVDAFREKFVEFIYKVYGTFTEISSNNSKPNTYIKRYYTIKDVPEQYVKDFVNVENARRVSTYWISKNNNYIMITQTNLSDIIQFNSEKGNLSEIIINKTPCLICRNGPLYYCYWNFDNCMFELVYPVDLGEEFMSEVVGNLVEIDPEELEN